MNKEERRLEKLELFKQQLTESLISGFDKPLVHLTINKKEVTFSVIPNYMLGDELLTYQFTNEETQEVNNLIYAVGALSASTDHLESKELKEIVEAIINGDYEID